MSAPHARTLHVHIGLPKTASTWLQEKVFPLLDPLVVRAAPRTTLFCAPSDAQIENRLLGCALRRAPGVWDAMGTRIFEQLFGARDVWLERTESALISDETIGRRAGHPDGLVAHLAAMRDLARDWGFQRLRLLVFLRRQDHWLASHYAQISDRRLGASQADFQRLVAQILDPARGRYGQGMLIDYNVLVAALYRAFGRADVSVVLYEALAAERDRTVYRLLADLDLADPDVERVLQQLDKTPSNQRTATPGRWTLRAQRIGFRHRRPGAGFALPFWLDLRRERTIEMTPELSAYILSTYDASNRALAGITGFDLARYGYFPATSA